MANLQIFISYAREDVEAARKLYRDLKNAELNPWLDEEVLLPGQNWKSAIKKAIKESRFFIALLSSNSVKKGGFRNFQEETYHSQRHGHVRYVESHFLPINHISNILKVNISRNLHCKSRVQGETISPTSSFSCY